MKHTRFILALPIVLAIALPCSSQQGAPQNVMPLKITVDVRTLTPQVCADDLKQWDMPYQNRQAAAGALDTQSLWDDVITMRVCARKFANTGDPNVGAYFELADALNTRLLTRACLILKSHNLIDELMAAQN